MSLHRRSRRPPATLWTPVIAAVVTAVLVGAARLMVGLRRRQASTARDAGAYAPEPLTGDPTSVAAEDVAPV